MSAFKGLLICFLLICTISSVTVDAASIGVSTGSLKWYLDSTEMGKEIRYTDEIVFNFTGSTAPENIKVYIEGVTDNLFYIESTESTINNTKLVSVVLYANVPNDIFHKGKCWNFSIVGMSMYGEYQHAVISKITVYTEEQSSGAYIVAGICIISTIVGLGWAISRRKEQYEKT